MQIFWVWVQCLADQLVDRVWSVIVAGIDVRDAALHRLTQHRDRLAAIAWRPPHAGTGELHGAIAHPAQREVVGKC